MPRKGLTTRRRGWTKAIGYCRDPGSHALWPWLIRGVVEVNADTGGYIPSAAADSAVLVMVTEGCGIWSAADPLPSRLRMLVLAWSANPPLCVSLRHVATIRPQSRIAGRTKSRPRCCPPRTSAGLGNGSNGTDFLASRITARTVIPAGLRVLVRCIGEESIVLPVRRGKVFHAGGVQGDEGFQAESAGVLSLYRKPEAGERGDILEALQRRTASPCADVGE